MRESLLSRPGEAQTVPITTRQLEAIVRLSESLAKMRLSAEATVSDVEEALRYGDWLLCGILWRWCY
ncbi:hypothetical protein EON65_12225 [archaeon]|nr:MAG: hypothetical protein EON65_12225 [archaeon]